MAIKKKKTNPYVLLTQKDIMRDGYIFKRLKGQNMGMMTTYSSYGSLKSKVLMGMVGGLQRGPRMGRRPGD